MERVKGVDEVGGLEPKMLEAPLVHPRRPPV